MPVNTDTPDAADRVRGVFSIKIIVTEVTMKVIINGTSCDVTENASVYDAAREAELSAVRSSPQS